MSDTIQVKTYAPANGHSDALAEGQSATHSLVVSGIHWRMTNKKHT